MIRKPGVTSIFCSGKPSVNSTYYMASISMRAGPASLQFDWSKVGLSMDLPVLIYSHTKTSLTFFQNREAVGQLFMWLKYF